MVFSPYKKWAHICGGVLENNSQVMQHRAIRKRLINILEVFMGGFEQVVIGRFTTKNNS